VRPSAAAISEVGSGADAEAEPSAGLLSESSALEPRLDVSVSVPFCFPPFVEVCLLWPSASAVRATWFDRTLANASVGGAPPVGGLVPWPPGVGGEPPAIGVPAAPIALPAPPPVAGTLEAAPADGASVEMTGIIDADPMPELMLPSGGSR
jgi:hypothetical protein